ncbi:MAG: bifunctional ornithine acetyltransferase/N-acetylglutamate synthase, partial [Sinobacterium sp.]|nr:bifunctional ornithine acetyltransferase/N-acetylglutamate synthase [Sinobacterium sp.]
MAVGNHPLPEFHPIAGIKIGTSNAGIKQLERADVTVFELCEGATVAALFTTNAFCAAPVQISKQHLMSQAPSYLLINTGNANAGTGAAGMQAANATVNSLAELQGVSAAAVLPFSTGVIGEVLPAEKLIAALPEAVANLSADSWADAASAIMTTDTRPKGISRKLHIAGNELTISGISKGSGMIKPNMATMLAYVGIDAQASKTLLQSMLVEAN